MHSIKSKDLFAIGATLCLLLAGCGSPQQKAANYIDRGNALYAKGDYDKARLEYKNAARIEPLAAEPRYRLGLVDEAEGDLHSAFADFTMAEQQDSHFHPAVLKIAQYYMGAEMLDPARQRIDSVLAENPKDAEAHALSAALLVRQGNNDAAEKEARQALSEDSANISAYAALAGLYTSKNELDKAIATTHEGITHNPQSLGLLMLQVNLYERANDTQKVADTYQTIFALKPTEVAYRIDLATLYAKQNKLDDAEVTLREGIKALPDNWDIKHQLILFLDEYRGTDAAENEMQSLMKTYPKNNDLNFWLADLYVTHDQEDKAIALLNKIVADGQDNAPSLNALTSLARIDIKQGNWDLAQKLVTMVLSKKSDNASALYIRADMAFEKGDYQRAVSDLRSILTANPKNQESLQLLGEIYLRQGHSDLAIDTIKKLAALNPANIAVQVRLAQMIDSSGDTSQALDLISTVTKAAPAYAIGWETSARIAIDAQSWLAAQEATQTLDHLDGQHSTALFLEGQILEKNGQRDQAIAKYKEVINPDPTTPLAEHAITSLVSLERKQGQGTAAINYLLTLNANTPLIMTLLGECYAAEGQMDSAATALDKAIAGHPSLQDPYLARATLYIGVHKPDMAVDILKKGALAIPNDYRAPLMEADIMTRTGLVDDAIDLYEDLLSRNPGFDVAANNLAEVIADYKFEDVVALEKARQTAERFTASTNPLLLDTLAWVYYRQNNLSLAETIMERAMAQGGSLPAQMHYHYGFILEKEGKMGKARAELKLATTEGADYPGIEEARKVLLAR